MTLQEYLDHYGIPPAIFAEKVGVLPRAIYRLLKEKKAMPSLRLAMEIEKFTEGKVMAKDLLK